MKEKIVEMKKLSYAYDACEEGKYALWDISVDIFRNERIAVLGANGAGKSTFFLTLNGVRQPESGEIYLHGEKIGGKSRNKLRKSVGIVFQDADSQIIASTVKAEVAFGPLNMKLAVDEVEARTKMAMERMQIQDLSDRPPHYLSGGEKKRVSIADILAMEPEMIIFDEPTASLDPAHADMLEDILDELGKEGKTILLSTHDVDFAYRFAERILIFFEGKLIADGKAQDIFRDEKILKMAHLKKPLIMHLFDLLVQNKIIEGNGCPRNFQELESLIQAISG